MIVIIKNQECNGYFSGIENGHNVFVKSLPQAKQFEIPDEFFDNENVSIKEIMLQNEELTFFYLLCSQNNDSDIVSYDDCLEVENAIVKNFK